MSRLPQVRAAATNDPNDPDDDLQVAKNIQGREVLTASAPIDPLGWRMFVELPVEEAYASLYDALYRLSYVLLGALIFAVLAGIFLARRMVVPIQALRAGAARIGSGDFGQQISIKTGDELEGLADQFNDMGSRLQESYADLENKVEQRTSELAQSVGELRALGEVSQAVNSTLDLEQVLSTIVTKATQLSNTEAGAIYVFDELQQEFRLRATYGMSEDAIAAIRDQHVNISEAISEATEQGEPIQTSDLRDESPSPVNEIMLREGYRARLLVPLLRSDVIYGSLVVRRKEPGEFPKNTVDLLRTFASQSVLAIQNARLFLEIEEKGRQLAEASKHKSQFLANMSHELRTPMNAILGYTELILDGIYVEPQEKVVGVLTRVQTNGKHLLGLINDVLDLSKIEAGQLVLSLGEYSIKDMVHNVFGTVESLAKNKNLVLNVEMPAQLPHAHGDERRLTQVLLNLVGNALKFTDKGGVTIKADAT